MSKIKKKNPVFCSPRFLGHTLWHPLIHIPSSAPSKMRYRPYTTLEDSSFGSNFREVSVAIILNLFWVVFHGILRQMLSNLYASFTSDAIKLSQKNEFLILRAFRFTLSWRYIIVVSFISIAFVSVSQMRTDSASTK